jgi:hypothetical protein
MFAKMKLRQRILLGYLAPLLVLLVANGVVFVNLDKVSGQYRLVEAAFSIGSDANGLTLAVGKMQRTVRGYMLLKNDTSRTAYGEANRQIGEYYERLVQAGPRPGSARQAEADRGKRAASVSVCATGNVPGGRRQDAESRRPLGQDEPAHRDRSGRPAESVPEA